MVNLLPETNMSRASRSDAVTKAGHHWLLIINTADNTIITDLNVAGLVCDRVLSPCLLICSEVDEDLIHFLPLFCPTGN